MAQRLAWVGIVGVFLWVGGCDKKSGPGPSGRDDAGTITKKSSPPAPKKTAPPTKRPAGQLSEREVTFQSTGIKLEGTFTVPLAAKGGKKVPAFFIVHGSGNQNRDGEFTQGGMTFRTYLEISRALVKAGFAVLRYDKRTYTMKKKGLLTLETVHQLTAQQPIDDGRAAFDFLTRQKEVDTKRIFFLGHSIAGAYVKDIIAGKSVAGVVLVAPIILPYREHLIHQADVQLKAMSKVLKNSPIMLPSQRKRLEQTVQMLTKMKTAYPKVFKMIDDGKFPAKGLVIGVPLAFHKGLEKLTAGLPTTFASLPVPVLYINGENDMICPVDAVKKFEPILRKKTDLTLFYVKDLGHHQYTMSTNSFVDAVPAKIASWAQQIPKK
ncbi:MAG: alpha/beta fold hydrolase [Myxococcales bacterium]|nr:alpha/beta fold hydrolase [Myxococcales bacterium]